MDRKPSLEIQLRLRRAFLAHGFRELTMGGIAQACGFTRRNLYFYFSSKEEVFRSSVAFLNEDNAARALAAGRALFEKGASATDVLTEILYVRYGVFRRELSVSPHAVELNTEAFRLCRDIMNETAASFAKAVAGVIGELARDGRLSLREEFTAAQIAQMLLDGARGTNQSLPPVAASALPRRYRMICQAILHGATAPVASAGTRETAMTSTRTRSG
ncbi:MAG: helix-turn-helix domain-containing protein [Xanthobacteraceae bacterium]